jgi:hypothetical protein
MTQQRHFRWFELISSFQISINFVDGYKNVLPDALSRLFNTSTVTKRLKEITTDLTQTDLEQILIINDIDYTIDSIKTPEEFLDDVSVYYVGPLNSQWGKGCILVAVDRLSRFVCTIATSKTLGSKETFLKLESHIFIPYGKYPKHILRVRGPQFCSEIWTNFLKKKNITCSLASVFYAPWDGLIEGTIQNVLQKLR